MTRRVRRRSQGKLNLIPVVTSLLLSVFILLMAPSFFNAHELVSPVSIKSDGTGLTLTFGPADMVLSQSGPIKTFKRLADGKYDLDQVKEVFAQQSDNLVRLEPSGDLAYEEIISIMDAIRKSRQENGFIILFGNLDK